MHRLQPLCARLRGDPGHLCPDDRRPLHIRRNSDQIKARNFEVPGCGGFLLSGQAENLADYYVDGQEIVIFKNLRDLIDKIRYYLEHDEERARIAEAGYERTFREHTYEHRFREFFARIGLDNW